MKKNSIKVFLGLTMMLLVILSACSGGGNKTSEGSAEKPKEEEKKQEEEDGLYSISDFNNVKTNMGDAIEGGTLVFGLLSDTPFEGTLNYNFYSGNPDAHVIKWFDEGLLTWDKNYNYTQDGAATFDISEDGRVFTFTIRDNVNWHDGTPVTAEDWLFSHEVIGHPDYTGVRFGENFLNIVGMDEYHEGKAESISGITVLNDKQLQIEFHKATPSLLTGGIWTYPLAKHIFGDMKVSDMAASDAVRKNPIGFGPFKVETITPGESVTYVRNDDYWRGKPNLDAITLRVISPNTVVQELQAGGVDLVSEFPVDQFPENANLSNIEWLGTIDRAYSYIGFKLGYWDEEKGENVMDENAKMADVNLRRAMWHAVDNQAVGERFYQGLRWAASTLIPPSHPSFHNTELKGLEYNPELAKQILEEAGYKDVNGDGFLETPEGEELVINYIAMTGGDVAQPLANYYVQSWKEVGLNVSLNMLEFNSFYDQVKKDNPEVDMYQAAWGVGINVDPAGLYSRISMYNYSRFTSEKNDELLAKGVSEEAFDEDYRREVYNEWQEYMIEEVPVFPIQYRSVVVPVNQRVHNVAVGDGTGIYLYELAVSQESSIVAE